MSASSLLGANGKILPQFIPSASTVDLISPVLLYPAAPYTSGVPAINIDGNGASAYGGSISLNPGSNNAAAAATGVNIKSAAAGCAVEVGTNGAGKVNTLSIAGASGLSSVYDGIYEQPVALVPITIGVDNFPPAVGNVGEIFRSTTFTGALQQNQQIVVPKTGWYVFQTEVRVGGTGITFPGVPGAVPGSITVSLSTGVSPVPYAVQTISALSLYNASDLDLDNYVIQSTVLLTAATNYTFGVLGAPNSGWDLGVNGQIKSELISLNQ